MSMICSTESCWSEEKDTTVGTSTNCSAICGALSTVRQQREGNEISGTSMTCSTGVCVSMSLKMLKMSTNCSPICGTGASRICTNGASWAICSAKCRPTRPCGFTSTRSAGRIPGGSRVCPRRAWCSSRTSPTPALVTVFSPRKASYLAPSTTLVSRIEGVVLEEWWSASARAIRTVCRSCFNHERSRRSRRRLAAPESRSPCSNMSTARATEQKTVLTHWCGRHSDRDACVFVVVVVVQTRCR